MLRASDRRIHGHWAAGVAFPGVDALSNGDERDDHSGDWIGPRPSQGGIEQEPDQQHRKQMSSISLCMIVKNEEATLERCLSSVAGIADEIIIVDTGSEDGTKEIAGKFTSWVVDFTWIDDFAAARNYSFAQANMDYILWLDADDVLIPEERAKFLELKSTLSPTIDAVSMTYHVAFDDSNNVTQSSRRFRLVRRSRNFVWAGVVHEDLVAEGPFQYFGSDIVVTHQKPVGESDPSRRNLLIYEKHFKAGREMRPVDLFHYPRELEAHGEFERAIPYYLEFLECKEADVELSLFTLDRLARCYYLTGNLEKE
jgi:glycosyltransferase involved in cell wall biosynthesis